MFSGKGGQGRRRKKKRGKTLEREESWWTEACLQFQNFSTADSWVHFNFSLIIHPFLSLKSLLICAKCLMLWDHSEYHLLDTAQGIDNSNSFPLFFLLKFCLFILVSSWSLSSLSTWLLLMPRAGRWNVLVMLYTISFFFFFLFLYVEELICSRSSSAL